MSNHSSQRDIASKNHSKTNEFTLTPDTISRNDTPILISNERVSLISHPHSHRVDRINFDFLYADGSRSNFISVGKVKLPYRPYLKCPKEFNSGKAATNSSSTFIGEYGTESIIVFIPTPIWDYIIKCVIEDLEERIDMFKEPGWEKRFREIYIKAKPGFKPIEGFRAFYAKMNKNISGTNTRDITNSMKYERADAYGYGQISIHLNQVRNPNQPLRWDLKLKIYQLAKEELLPASDDFQSCN